MQGLDINSGTNAYNENQPFANAEILTPKSTGRPSNLGTPNLGPSIIGPSSPNVNNPLNGRDLPTPPPESSQVAAWYDTDL